MRRTISTRDYRAIHRLVDDVLSVRHSAETWVQVALAGLSSLLGAPVITAGMMRLPAPGAIGQPTAAGTTNRDNDGTGFPDALFSHGLSDEQYRQWLDYMFDPAQQCGARTFARFASIRARFVTVRRRDVIPDDEWYNQPVVTDLFRTLDLDDNMVSNVVALSVGRLFGFGVHRHWGDTPFSVRDRRMLRLFHLELARAYHDRLARPDEPTVARLSTRQNQVLWLLCSGCAEKQVATRLSLSIHTVHNHVKALHKIFDVTSRGELVSKVLRQPMHPGLLTLPSPNIPPDVGKQ